MATPTSKAPEAVALAERDSVTDRTFARHGRPATPRLAWFVDGLARALTASGYEPRDTAGPDVQVVLHAVDVDRPRPYRRKHAPTFVVAAAAHPGRPDDLLRAGYPVLVRALANLVVLVSDDGPPAAHFVTLEQGTTTIEHHGDDEAFFRTVFERVAPLASSRLVIANEFRPDLDPTLAGATSRPLRSVGPARGWPTCICSRRRSRSRTSSPNGTCGTSSCSTASGASATGTSARGGSRPPTRGSVPSTG